MPPAPYRGRFAPSPSGALHFGSLVAAVGSFADARHQGGTWLVRMEDLDRQRTLPGAASAILGTLDAFGLRWDGEVVYQSQGTEHYEAALERLRKDGLSYPCGCTRREIAALGRQGAEGPIYAGTCRNGLPPDRSPRSERLRVDGSVICIDDRIQGTFSQDLSTEIGDFVLRRADGFHAYQLAVVVDDAEQGITQIVRGADLLFSTPRQRYLQRLLTLAPPAYAHLPIALDRGGSKLSKSLASLPVDANAPVPALMRAWQFLGQKPLQQPAGDVETFWQQAIPGWDIGRVPSQLGRRVVSAVASTPRGTAPDRRGLLG